VLRISTHDQLIVVVSDLAGAVSEMTRRHATELRRRNELMVLWVHDPLEEALPDVGEAVLGDGRLQLPVNTSSREIRDRFVADVRARRARASAFALNFDVPLLPLSTAEDVLPQLRRLLGHLERPPKV